jgi:hypothetical protein
MSIRLIRRVGKGGHGVAKGHDAMIRLCPRYPTPERWNSVGKGGSGAVLHS